MRGFHVFQLDALNLGVLKDVGTVPSGLKSNGLPRQFIGFHQWAGKK